MKQLGATCLMVFILIAGFTGPIHYRILLEPSSSMNSQQVSTSPCSIVWLLNAVLQLRALIFYQTCCSGHNFPSCHSSLSLHGTECLTCKGFANVMMMQFAIADHVATHACTYMPQPITILVQSAVWLQNKLYPYGSTQTLGDGILGSIGISTHYYWCWIAIGICLAYILLFNVIIVILLTVLPRKFVFPSTLSVVVQRVLIWYSAWCCLFSGAGVWHPICATNAVTLCTSCLVFPELSSAAAHIPCNVLLNIGPSCFL